MALRSAEQLSTGMLMRIRCQDFRAGCTQYPSRVPIHRDRELLAADGAGGGNATGTATTGNVSVGANSSSYSS